MSPPHARYRYDLLTTTGYYLPLPTTTYHYLLRALQARGARAVLVTLGAEGALLLTEAGNLLRQPPCAVHFSHPLTTRRPCPHAAAACGISYGCSLHNLWWQHLSLMVAASVTYGCSLHHFGMQVPGGAAVDETGAGDSFRAAFCLAIVEGEPSQTP